VSFTVPSSPTFVLQDPTIAAVAVGLIAPELPERRCVDGVGPGRGMIRARLAAIGLRLAHDPDVNVKLPRVSTATLTNGHGNGTSPAAAAPERSNYRWIALATVTLGTLMVFINQSIVLISLPDIFRGIQLNPLTPGNTGYLLWMLMGFSVVLAVLVVTLGRVGDIFGRVRIFNLGFVFWR
jgi:hypothetical protein